VSLDSLVLERRNGDGEVAGSTLTHCAVEYSKPLTHTFLCHQLAVSFGIIVEGR